MKFTSKTPHFFKIILNHTVEDGKIRVPTKFASKYGDVVPSKVELKVPNGEVWSVEFKKHDNGEVWLNNGWKQFGERYSLRNGDMVSFKYKGNGDFEVVIFDMTATEVEYPQKIIFEEACKETSIVEIEDDTTSESSESCGHLSRRKRKEISPLESSRVNKRSNSNSNAKMISSANSFKSKNPFFRVLMRSSYLSGKGCYMNLPLTFARRHLKEIRGVIILKFFAGEKIWNVKYKLTTKNCCLKTARFCNGWKVFACDNNLKIDDECVFEMKKHNERIILDVFVFPAVEEDQNRGVSLASTSRDNGAIQKPELYFRSRAPKAEQKLVSKKPFFKKHMRKCYIDNGHLRPPIDFIKKYGKRLGAYVIFHIADNSWNVIYNSQLCLFTSGWSKFVKDNSIRVGDTCLFELIKSHVTEFKVTVSKYVA